MKLEVIRKLLLFQPDDHHDQVQRQVRPDQHDGDADGLGEAAQEDRGQQGQQQQGDQQGVVGPRLGDERVLHQMRGRVGGGQRHGDQEVGGREAEQDQDEHLAGPLGQVALQHRDGALAVRALLGHPPVDRQGAQQREQDEHDRGERGEQAGGERGDAGLVAQRREVVDAGQAHDLPPGVPLVLGLGDLAGAEVVALLVDQALQEPRPEAAGSAGRRGPGTDRAGRGSGHLSRVPGPAPAGAASRSTAGAWSRWSGWRRWTSAWPACGSPRCPGRTAPRAATRCR